MADTKFSLKGIKRLVIGLALAAFVALVTLVYTWGNPRPVDLTLEQAAILTGFALLLGWCVVVFEMIESQEENFEARILEEQRKKRAA